MSTQIFSDALHAASQILQTPVIILLLFLMVVSVLCLGSILVETVTERRRLRKAMPAALAATDGKTTKELYQVIEDAGILSRHKRELRQLLDNRDSAEDTLCTIAQANLTKEEMTYRKAVEKTDMVSKLGPMLGLMGTLIPLGPGILALGNGDTQTLSASLLVAFDTTIAGVACAAVCYVISTIRKRWYRGYTVTLESLMETILEAIRKEKEPAARIGEVIE